MLKAAVVYWSKTGNTKKVAQTIHQVLEKEGLEVIFAPAEQASDLDWFAYDLICLGFPSYRWRPPKPVDDLLNDRFNTYSKQDRVKVGTPRVNRYALLFCTYSGPHTGIDEAIPATQYAAQFFEHLGITVLDRWHIVGEFHGSLERSTQGRLGDIRGRPDSDDLGQVRRDTVALVQRLRSAPRPA